MIHPFLSEDSLAEFSTSAISFLAKYSLSHFVDLPLDHIAIKLANTLDYEAAIETIRDSAHAPITYMPDGGRRIAMAFLKSSLSLPEVGDVATLEVMEPRAHRVGLDTVGIDHIELVYPDLTAAGAVLTKAGVTYVEQGNDYHTTLVMVINEKGQEIKLSDRPITETLAAEDAAGVEKGIA